MEDNEFEEVTIISHTDHGTSVLPQSAGLDSESRVTLKVASLKSFKSSQHFAKHLAEMMPKKKKLNYPIFHSVEMISSKLRGLQQDLIKRYPTHTPSELHLDFICWHEDGEGSATFIGNNTTNVFLANPDLKITETISVTQEYGTPVSVFVWNLHLVVVYSDAPIHLYSGIRTVDRNCLGGRVATRTTKHLFGGSMSWHLFSPERELCFLSTDQKVIRVDAYDFREVDVTPEDNLQVQDFTLKLRPKLELVCLDSLGYLVSHSQKENVDELFRSTYLGRTTKKTKFVPQQIRRLPIGLLVAGVCLPASSEGYQNGLMLLDIGSLKPSSVGQVLCGESQVLSQFRFCTIGSHKIPGFFCKDEEKLYLCSFKIGKIFLVTSVDCMWINHIVYLGPVWMLLSNYDSTNILTISYNT